MPFRVGQFIDYNQAPPNPHLDELKKKCADYGTPNWDELLSPTATLEQEKAAWKRYLDESRAGQNLCYNNRFINAERIGFEFVKDVAVGEEIFIVQS